MKTLTEYLKTNAMELTIQEREKEIAANNRLIESKLSEVARLRRENDQLIRVVERMTQDYKIKELCEK